MHQRNMHKERIILLFKNLAKYRFENNFVGSLDNYVEHLSIDDNFNNSSNQFEYLYSYFDSPNKIIFRSVSG